MLNIVYVNSVSSLWRGGTSISDGILQIGTTNTTVRTINTNDYTLSLAP